MTDVEIIGVSGIRGIGQDCDLAELIVSRTRLMDGDVVVTDSAAISKAEGSLPSDLDTAARALRRRIGELRGVKVAVVISEPARREGREGLVDIGIGASGIAALREDLGQSGDAASSGEKLPVADVDAVAAAAELVRSGVAETPVVVVRGASYYVDDQGATRLAVAAG